MNNHEAFSDLSREPGVRGFLHKPEMPSGNGLVLTHGAGGNAQMALLVALAEAFAGAGFMVLRCDLPFRQARRFGPPRPGDAARDREGLKNAIAAMKRLDSGRVFIGGQSYGGRQASMLLAEEKTANGLLLLSYPLHAPSRPGQPRTQHLPQLQVPTLFVHGTRDPFGSIEEIEGARKLILAKTELLVVEGAGHDLGFKGKSNVRNCRGKSWRFSESFSFKNRHFLQKSVARCGSVYNAAFYLSSKELKHGAADDGRGSRTQRYLHAAEKPHG